jgi:hypothetical protein
MAAGRVTWPRASSSGHDRRHLTVRRDPGRYRGHTSSSGKFPASEAVGGGQVHRPVFEQRRHPLIKGTRRQAAANPSGPSSTGGGPAAQARCAAHTAESSATKSVPLYRLRRICGSRCGRDPDPGVNRRPRLSRLGSRAPSQRLGHRLDGCRLVGRRMSTGCLGGAQSLVAGPGTATQPRLCVGRADRITPHHRGHGAAPVGRWTSSTMIPSGSAK